ncbi:unnamed protein product [Paramecium primaurelia]|uniref:RING-type domain-containing protein n=1 Tax=Paramecium primaurelia TaxID=5886 RepID=A0A8S1JPW3_PARPR|nr:unnamed protein product [Paramecium primaurelia]
MSQIDSQLLRSLIVNPESIDENFLCGICCQLVVNPKECENCQHLYCLECIQDWLKKNKICPYRCTEGEIKLKEPHRFVKNSISHLNLKCQNADCDQIIELGLMDSHYKECKHTIQNCQNEGCQDKIKNLNLEEHKQKCQFRKVTCDQCLVIYMISQDHNCIRSMKQQIDDQNLIINQLKQLVLQQQATQQEQQQQIKILQQLIERPQGQKYLVCDKGHQLIWINPLYNQKCGRCLQNNEISRFKCQQCQKIYCQSCKKPYFYNQKCPSNHQLQFDKIARASISCDFCGEIPFKKGEGVWSDRECDFDICISCYNKAQQ